MSETLLDLADSSATHVGTKIPSIHLAKVVIALLRKLDRDSGLTDNDYLSLLGEVKITDDPATVVP